MLCLLCASVHRGDVSVCRRTGGGREKDKERENIWRVCAAKWCVSVCSRGNLNEKTWKVANLGFVSLQVPLSYKLPITLPYPCCPRPPPSNSPLNDSEILKCRPGRQQPLAHGTNFREKAIKSSLKIVQFSGTPELNLPLKVAFFLTPCCSSDWCTLGRWIWKMFWWNTLQIPKEAMWTDR